MHWLSEVVRNFEWTWEELYWFVGLFLVSFVGSLAVVTVILVKLPATYFCEHHTSAFAWTDRHPALRTALVAGKNILGFVLVIVGIILSLPGVPGQGILTILIGVMLLDFPGRRKLERRIVSRPAVRRAVDRLRARFGKPPLVLEQKACSPHDGVPT